MDKKNGKMEFERITKNTPTPQRLSSPQSLLHSDHLLEQEATQILALDQYPFSVNLFPQHEVAFPVHQPLVNLLEFELVVPVVAVAVVPDLVSTRDAHVLVSCLGASCFICGLGSG